MRKILIGLLCCGCATAGQPRLYCGFAHWNANWTNPEVLPAIARAEDVNGVAGMGGLEVRIPARTGLWYLSSPCPDDAAASPGELSFCLRSDAVLALELCLRGRKVWGAPVVSKADGQWHVVRIPIGEFRYFDTVGKSRQARQFDAAADRVDGILLKVFHAGDRAVRVAVGPIFAGTPPEPGSAFAVVPGPVEPSADAAAGGLSRQDREELAAYFDMVADTRDPCKWQRPISLWKYYTHGITDRLATPLRIAELWGEGDDPASWLCPTERLPALLARPAYDVVRIDGNSGKGTLAFSQPLPVEAAAHQGRRLRFFVWIKADKPSPAFLDYPDFHSRPEMHLTFRDATGKTIKSSCGYFLTPGPYPWHCYHMEEFVPAETATIHPQFTCLGGTACFAAPSWELVQGTFSEDDRQDPFSGSQSKNVHWDTLDTLYRGGYARRYVCRWLQGAAIGLQGAAADLTSRAGLREYFEKVAQPGREINGFNQLITALPGMMKNFENAGVMPPSEDGLSATLAEIIRSAQLPNGLWAVGHWPDGSDGLTCHTLTKCFYYRNIPRQDPGYPGNGKRWREPVLPGFERVPRAAQIIRTFAARQIEYTDADGRVRTAGWHGNFGAPAAQRRSDMQSTANTIYSMRIALCDVHEPEVRDLCYRSVKAAVESVLRFNFLPDWGWRHSNLHEGQTINAYMPWILGVSPYLERKIRADIPAPTVAVQRDGETAIVRWLNPEQYNAVRVYALAPEHVGAEVDEEALVGIIHRRGHVPVETDPILVVKNVRDAYKKRCGSDPRSSYPWKQNKLDAVLPFPVVTDAAPLRLTPTPGTQLWVSTVTWYGEESVPVKPSTQDATR